MIYYDSNPVQFLSRDPVVAKTQSPYGYLHNDPLNAVDPSDKDDYNTVPPGYKGPTAFCLAGTNTYTLGSAPSSR